MLLWHVYMTEQLSTHRQLWPGSSADTGSCGLSTCRRTAPQISSWQVSRGQSIQVWEGCYSKAQ